MKVTLSPGQFVFDSTAKTLTFDNMGGLFAPERLLAVTNITTGKLIYAVASNVAGYGGSFSNGIYGNSVLTYNSSNAGQANTDIIECLYDDQFATQPISGTINSYIFDSSGNGIGGVYDPISGEYQLRTSSFIKASDGTDVLTTTDAMSGKEGLDVNLLNSSFGGQIGNPMPIPNNNNALSVGFLNGSNLVAPAMDPVTNELKVQGTFTAPALQNVNLTEVSGSSVTLGQTVRSGSLPVTLASDQPPIVVSTTAPIDVTVTQSVSQDILGVAVGGNRNNQIEVSFNSAPGATLITNTFTGSGAVTVANGHSIYSTGTTASSSASGTSVQTTSYRPAHEIYAAFTAAFLNPNAFAELRIGLFDNTDGFFIGYDGSFFGVTVRSGGADSFTDQSAFNVDTLTGASGSKFTRNGNPEAVNFALSNLYRIRFAWLGSANIFFEIFSPDAEWVLFHNVKQPNTAYNPSITNPNLPMRVQLIKTAGATNSSIATACWGAGTTSAYSPITATLTDNSLAAITRSVITGVTTGGGGGYVNVKVNPSGALVTDSTVSSSVLPTGAATSANQTNGTQLSRVTDGTNTAAVKAASTAPLATDPSLVVTVSPNSPTLPTSTNINQYGGVSTSLGQKAAASSIPVTLSSDSASGNITTQNLNATGAGTAGSTVGITSTGYGGAVIDIRGVYTGTIAFQTTIDGTNWITTQATPYGVAQNVALASATTTGQTGAWIVNCVGSAQVRASASSVMGGTANIQVRGISSTGWVYSAPVGLTNAMTISSGTTVVTQATPANLNVTAAVTGASLAQTASTDLNAVSVTTTGTSATITPVNSQSAAFALVVTVTSGSGTLDVTLQEALDNGGTLWENIYSFERITTAVRIYIPAMRLSGTNLRLAYTVTGTVNYAVTLIRTTRQVSAPMLRRLLDRTIVPATLNSTSGALWVDGCSELDLSVVMAAGGTAPVIQLQGSEDSSNWYNIGTSLTATVGASTNLGVTDGSLPKWIRAQVTTAGAGSALTYLALKGKSGG